MTRSANDRLSTFESLTEKQREVLDLLIEHKTSKEIARVLQISPYTVDQRINFAKKKLSVDTRGAAASAYREIKQICEQSVYEKPDIDEPIFFRDGHKTDDASAYLFLKPRSWNKVHEEERKELDYRVVPEMFEGRSGKRNRIVATVSIAILILILGLSGLAIFSVISDMVAH